jgi:hypothetical protein
VIGLFADLVVATLRWLSRATPAIPPAVAVAQPTGAGAGQPPGSGGPPRPTSELLLDAALWVAIDFPDAGHFVCELEDRARSLAAVGD